MHGGQNYASGTVPIFWNFLQPAMARAVWYLWYFKRKVEVLNGNVEVTTAEQFAALAKEQCPRIKDIHI